MYMSITTNFGMGSVSSQGLGSLPGPMSPMPGSMSQSMRPQMTSSMSMGSMNTMGSSGMGSRSYSPPIYPYSSQNNTDNINPCGLNNNIYTHNASLNNTNPNNNTNNSNINNPANPNLNSELRTIYGHIHHPHTLQRCDTGNDWCCAGNQLPGGCKRGTALGQTNGESHLLLSAND